MGGFSLNLPNPGTFGTQGNSADYWHNLVNTTSSAGQQLLGAGTGTTNTGLQQVNSGLGQVNTGQGTLATSLSTLDPSIAYWNAILSGNPQALAAATAPTANALSSVYSGATNNASMNNPAGGYRSTTMAALPQSYASQVGNYLLGLQPTAAQNLNTLAGTQAGIGSAQGQLGLGTSQVGLGTGQLGLGQSQLGSNLLVQALNQLMQKIGINQQASNAALGAGAQLGSSLIGATGQVAASGNNPFSSQQSDMRIKEGVVPLGNYNGLPVYAFRIKGSDEVRLGVMAQEAREIVPESVHEGPDRILRVDYDLLFSRLNLGKAA